MSEANYVPLSDIAGQELSRLSWHVELNDYIDSSSIGLHVMRLERLTEIGRIAHMTVSMAELGRGKIDYEFGGVNEDGSTTYLFTNFNSVTSFKADIESVSDPRNIRTSLTIDSKSLHANVLAQHRSARDTEGWAQELDKVLGIGALELIRLNLGRNDRFVSARTLAVASILSLTKIIKKIR